MNSEATFDWISKLIDQCEMQRALENTSSQNNASQILCYSCFRPALMMKCWHKMSSWNLLQQGLDSRANLWNNECGLLTIMCYANCGLRKENLIKESFWDDKFHSKNALQHAIEHGNAETVKKLIKTDKLASKFLNSRTSYEGKSAIEFARGNHFPEIADILSKRNISILGKKNTRKRDRF